MPVPASLKGHRLPDPFRRFLELYGAGRYWDSHEALEDRWRETGSDFYQGLILYASAWVHWERRNGHGVRAQLRKAVERLSAYPSAYHGIDVAALRAHCLAAGEIATMQTDGWHEQIGPIDLTLTEGRLRGDEMELDG